MDEIELTNDEARTALGHALCEGCGDEVCLNSSHGACVCDEPEYVAPQGETFCANCAAEARAADGVPVVVDAEEETTPVENESMERIVFGNSAGRGVALRRSAWHREPAQAKGFISWFWALACLAAAAWGFSGCAGHAAPPAVEAVGQLANGPSVWSAPVHETTPPPEFGVAEGSDDDVADVATTVVRADGGDDAAPEVTEKGAGLQIGGGR